MEDGIEPVYDTLKGWNRSLEGITDFEDLPVELTDYIKYLEVKLAVPVSVVSVGPDRKQTIMKNKVLA
jgi:adenylosuccinate synthase